MSSSSSPQPPTKLVFVGQAASGKSSLINRMMNMEFQHENVSTVGVNFGIVDMGNNINLHVWDTAGASHYKEIIKYYFRGIEAALIAVPCDQAANPESWPGLRSYVFHIVDDIRANKNSGMNSKLSGIPDFTVPIILVMTKSDLMKGENHRYTVARFAQELVEQAHLRGFVTLSAKTMTPDKLRETMFPYVRQIFLKTLFAKRAASSSHTTMVNGTCVTHQKMDDAALGLSKKCCTLM